LRAKLPIVQRQPSLSGLCLGILVIALLSPALASETESQQELNKALMAAAKRGDVRAAKSALEKGADPNARVPGTWLNYTPLLQSVSEGHLRVAELLLDYGADPYLEDENHDTAIGFAAAKGKEPIFELLLSRGAPINWKNSDGLTVAERGDMEVLLKYGLDPNQKTGDGGCLLITAADNDNPDLLKVLLSHGATIDAQDQMGNTALMRAIDQRREKAIAFLLSAGADINVQNSAGNTALLLAISFRTDTAAALIKHGASVNLATKTGETPLMAAAKTASVDVVKLLLDHGADVRAQTKNGETAIHFAAGYYGYDFDQTRAAENRQNPIRVLFLLEEHGANLKAVTAKAESALHFAADTGRAGTLRVLLERGLDSGLADKNGDTPLYFAIRSHTEDKLEKAKLLVGSDVNATNRSGDSPLLVAAAAMEGPICRLLLDNGASVDAVNTKGETPLLLATSSFNREYVEPNDYVEIIRALVTRTSKIDNRDGGGMTAAMWSSASNSLKALDAILNKGADIHTRSKDGRTCLMWAASANATDTIRLLIDRGADIKDKDSNGRTAADWARLLGYNSIVGFLNKASGAE
jgi:ankyrin repeat protein